MESTLRGESRDAYPTEVGPRKGEDFGESPDRAIRRPARPGPTGQNWLLAIEVYSRNSASTTRFGGTSLGRSPSFGWTMS